MCGRLYGRGFVDVGGTVSLVDWFAGAVWCGYLWMPVAGLVELRDGVDATGGDIGACAMEISCLRVVSVV